MTDVSTRDTDDALIVRLDLASGESGVLSAAGVQARWAGDTLEIHIPRVSPRRGSLAASGTETSDSAASSTTARPGDLGAGHTGNPASDPPALASAGAATSGDGDVAPDGERWTDADPAVAPQPPLPPPMGEATRERGG